MSDQSATRDSPECKPIEGRESAQDSPAQGGAMRGRRTSYGAPPSSWSSWSSQPA